MSEGFKPSGEVKFEAEKLEQARAYEEKLQDLAWTLVSSLHMLVRNVKLYGPENEIFQKPMEKLRDCVNTILAVDGKLNLQCAGTSFYLNGMLLRIDPRYVETVKYLHQEFERCDVGGFSLDKSINLQELRNLIYIFGKENQEQPGEDGVSGRKLTMLKLRQFQVAKEILEHQKEIQVVGDEKLDRRRYTIVIYARLVHYMQKVLAGLRGEGDPVSMLQSRHLIQDLVDACFGHRTHFLGIATARCDATGLAYHAVNITVLAIVFGIEIGLSKERLRELAMAALFHDIGKAEVDPGLLGKRERWTPEERAGMARIPLLSARRLLRTRRLDLANMHNIVAAFYHQIEYGRPLKDLGGKTTMVEPVADLSVYTKIVAVVDAYESLTHHWGYPPGEALKAMSTELLHRFDPVFVRIFSTILSGLATQILEDEEAVKLFSPD